MTVALQFRCPEFEAAIEDRPGDQGLRLVYADLCDERGDDRYAAALRWLARWGLGPINLAAQRQFDIRTRWIFGNQPRLTWADAIRREYRGCMLPGALFAALRLVVANDAFFDAKPHVRDDLWAYFSTQAEATEYLARALEAEA